MSIFSWFHDHFFGGSSGSPTAINPATGLPMVGGVDVLGNPYGTSHDHTSSTASSHDHMSSSSSTDHSSHSSPWSSGGSSGGHDW